MPQLVWIFCRGHNSRAEMGLTVTRLDMVDYYVAYERLFRISRWGDQCSTMDAILSSVGYFRRNATENKDSEE